MKSRGVVEGIVIGAALKVWSGLTWAVTFVAELARLAALWLTPSQREQAIARDVWRTVTGAVAWAGDRLATAEPILDRVVDRGQELFALGLVLVRDGAVWARPRLVGLGATVLSGLWFTVLVLAWLARLAWPVLVNVAAGTWAALVWLVKAVVTLDWRRAVEPLPEPPSPVALPLASVRPVENLRKAA